MQRIILKERLSVIGDRGCVMEHASDPAAAPGGIGRQGIRPQAHYRMNTRILYGRCAISTPQMQKPRNLNARIPLRPPICQQQMPNETATRICNTFRDTTTRMQPRMLIIDCNKAFATKIATPYPYAHMSLL
jgi:hypothetical protein